MQVIIDRVNLEIKERTARDQYLLAEEFKKNEPDKYVVYLAILLSQSLKKNLKGLKWYQLFKRWKIKKITSPEFLLNYFSVSELDYWASKVLELEASLVKKKTESQSQSAE